MIASSLASVAREIPWPLFVLPIGSIVIARTTGPKKEENTDD